MISSDKPQLFFDSWLDCMPLLLLHGWPMSKKSDSYSESIL